MQKRDTKNQRLPLGGIAFRAAICLFLLTICVSGCAKPQIIVPSVTPEESDVHLTGKFVWYDLFTHDISSVALFYEGLFGWEFSDTEAGNHKVKTIFRDGVPIANASEISPLKKGQNESRWLGYMSIPDMGLALETVVANSGRVYRKSKELPHRGEVAVIIDPEEAILGLVRTAKGDPVDRDYTDNNWMGSELWANRPDDEIAFYNKLVGYEERRVEMGDGEVYSLLLSGDYVRAGVTPIMSDGIKPTWIPYISVEDIMMTAKRAEELGGELLMRPGQREGRTAIIADPSGAVFGVQELKY